MNKEEYLTALQDFERLGTITYQQIEHLLLRFPYCHGLRILLLRKYKGDRHPAYERHLGLAAVYLPDRKQLQRLMQIPSLKNVKEDLPIQKIEKEEISVKNGVEEENVLKEKEIVSKIILGRVSENPPQIELFPEEEKSSVDSFEDWVANFKPIEKEIYIPENWKNLSEEQQKEMELAKQRKRRFKLPRIPIFEDKSILNFFEEESDTSNSNPQKQKKRKPEQKKALKEEKGKKKGLFNLETEDFLKSLPQMNEEQEPLDDQIVEDFDHLAKKSVVEDGTIASETLANLLALQGRYTKAIEMYEVLKQQKPEQSSLFEEKIQGLKDKKHKI